MLDFPPLLLSSVTTPATQDELAALVLQAYADSTPLYPIGGGTSLDYGLAPKRPGVGLVLISLNRVIDFPARDLTVTVEAGITMQALADVLAKEGLRLPVDVPLPDRATLGGVIATGWSGPRRYGHGSIRDFVIGIRAIDGRGNVFNGGGRVVKNVAGYDFCKLLTGSMGTIGILAQVTLKLRPLAQQTAVVRVPLPSLTEAEALLDVLAVADITPVALELRRTGESWAVLVVLEGTPPEVAWMQTRLGELVTAVGRSFATVPGGEEEATLREDVATSSAPLVLKASVLPSQLTKFLRGALAFDLSANVSAHAGNGLAYIAYATFPKDGLSRTLVGQLQPLASQYGGHVVVLSNPTGQEATPQSTWGTLGAQHALMASVKEQFDPRNILNPGRYVFAG